MANLQQLEFFLLRYSGDASKRESVNLGVIAIGRDGPAAGFADVRFTKNWRRLRCFDPLVDTEELEAIEREIRRDLQDPERRAELLKRTGDAWSNAVRCELLQGCLTASPANEIEKLASIYLETPNASEKQEVGGRQRILNVMKNELELAGVLPLMLRDIPLAEYTRAGDPLKLDFGYVATGDFKFLQAVSLAQRVDSAMMLAARFPQVAAGMMQKKSAKAWLTAIVDDELPKRDDVDFALEMLDESGIAVARAAEMPKIAEGIRLELRT